MKKILFLIVPLTLGPAFAAPDFNAVLEAHHQANQFMGTVVILKDGQRVFEKAIGKANLEFDVPAGMQTVYEIGSITKSFTAAAILKLQEQGKLKVSDPVSTFLPGFPNGDRITLHHLLTHTSGLQSFTGFPDFLETQKLQKTQDQLIDSFKNLPLEFEPGDRFQYSNSGFTLLGKVIEVASGQPYQDYITENILSPLGFKQLQFHSRLDLVPNRATGYVPDGISYRLPESHNVEIAGPAGGLFATANELALWLPSLSEGKVLGPEGVKAFTTAQVHIGNEPGFQNYGYGVGVGSFAGKKVLAHGGNINGFNAMMLYFPEEKLSIVALSNLDGNGSNLLANDLAKVALGEEVTLPEPRVAVDVPVSVLETYAGLYEVPDLQTTLRIFVKKGQLMVEVPGAGEFALVPEGNQKFYLSIARNHLTFSQGPEGMVLEISAGENRAVGKKVQ